MPTDHYNPVLSGLTTALSMANLLHRQRLQDEALELQKRQIADQEQRQQYQQGLATADFQTKLNALGARQVTPSDELEAQTGTRIDFGPMGVPLTSQSDIANRMLKFGGNKYVLPSDEEREQRADRASDRQIKRDTAKVKAEGEARTASQISGKQAEIDKMGIAIKDEDADILGIARGSKVLPEHLDDYMRAVTMKRAEKMATQNNVAHAVPIYGNREQGVAVILRDGTLKWNPIKTLGGKAHAPERGESPTETRLNQERVLNTLVEETASRYVTSAKTPQDAETKLKADTDKDPFLKKNYLRILKQIRSAREKATDQSAAGIKALLGDDEEETPAAAPKSTPAAAPKPSGPTPAAADYLKKRGIR